MTAFRTTLLLGGMMALLTAHCRAQEVALTFDDLPRTGELPPGMTRVKVIKTISKILQEAQAPRVYGFVNGVKIESAPAEREALETWTAAGFPLANHGYSHLNLAETTVRRYTRDIAANEPLLRSLMPKESDWRWFRYPYLEEGESLRKKYRVAAYLKKNRYRVAEVTLDFEDFLWNAPYARCVAQNNEAGIGQLKLSYLAAAEERITLGQKMSQALYGRDIKHVMLLHVGPFETVMLPQLLRLLKQKNFKLVTLEEAANDPAYESDPEWPTRHGGDLLTLMMRHRGLLIPAHKNLPKEELDATCRSHRSIRSAKTQPDQAATLSQPGRRRRRHRSTPTQ